MRKPTAASSWPKGEDRSGGLQVEGRRRKARERKERSDDTN